jgi:hypothetical protein
MLVMVIWKTIKWLYDNGIVFGIHGLIDAVRQEN